MINLLVTECPKLRTSCMFKLHFPLHYLFMMIKLLLPREGNVFNCRLSFTFYEHKRWGSIEWKQNLPDHYNADTWLWSGFLLTRKYLERFCVISQILLNPTFSSHEFKLYIDHHQSKLSLDSRISFPKIKIIDTWHCTANQHNLYVPKLAFNNFSCEEQKNYPRKSLNEKSFHALHF